ncbi:autophagy protein [Mortierella alpina]|nr:autophagy protein [Mortierella alpina]
MNVAARSGELLFINFNQDFSCISVGTKHGFKIYNCDPFGKCYSKTDSSIGIVEMLFCTSLVATVGAGDHPASSPRRLQIINTKVPQRQSTICELTFPTTILSVKLNRKRLIVVLEDQIYVYDISNMKLLHTVETSPNPHAICALSPSSENCYLAYPSPTPSPTSPFSNNGRDDSHGPFGDVLIFNALTLQVVNIVQAHKTSVSNISINSEGTMLATASDKGTVIRIWSIPNAQRLYQFRRGAQSARIHSLSFNLASTLLCVSSDTDTVHIFKVGGPSSVGGGLKSNGGSLDGSLESKGSGVSSLIRRQSMNIGRNLAGSVGSYLPGAITEMFEPSRDFAHLKLPNSGVQSVIALSNTTPQVMVATSDGYLYQYNIDLENGGPCVLLKQFSLLDSEDKSGADASVTLIPIMNSQQQLHQQQQQQQQQQQSLPQTPHYNSGISSAWRTSGYSNSMQPPQSVGAYSSGSGGTSTMASANGRWSMSSGLRQSSSGALRSSILNSSVMMSQRPSPMAPLTVDEYGALSSSVMGPPMGVGNRFAPRQSMSGSAGPRPSLSGTVSMKDPRPIKDKAFQRSLVHSIVDYLTQNGYPNSITPKNLMQPTNKDFQDVFKFLYQKLEPRYIFQKKFEDEVPVLMKTMRYPAADTISKTALYTVGAPHSWPSMLALLGWMVDVVTKHKENTKALRQSNAHNRDRDIDPRLDMSQVSPEGALYNYLTMTYRTWMLTGNLQDAEVEESMGKSFENRRRHLQEQLRIRSASLESLRRDLEAARAEVPPIVVLERENQVLKNDIEQFKKGIDHAVPRIEEVRKANEESNRTISAKQAKLADLRRAKNELQEIVRTQTMTRTDLESKLAECSRLRRREEGLKQQLLDIKKQKDELEKRFQSAEGEAEQRVKEYNALAMKVGLIPASARYAHGQDLELRLDVDGARTGEKLYNVDTKARAEKVISTLRNQFTMEVNKIGNELSALQEELDRLDEQIEDDNTELRDKEHQLNMLTKKYQDEKENARAEALSHQMRKETREQEMQSMDQEITQSITEAERLDQENEMLERQAALNREVTHRRIKDVLEHLTDIKRHVEEQVGLIQTMASKKREEALLQKQQLQRSVELERELQFTVTHIVQVDAALLRNLICQKQTESQENQLQVPEDSVGVSKGLTAQPTEGGAINQGFQPQRKYFLEGRIIHKRKLSKRLFFLDVSLVRRKKQLGMNDSTAAAIPERLGSGEVTVSGLAGSSANDEGRAIASNDNGAREEGVEGLKLSGWEDDVESRDSQTDKAETGVVDRHSGALPQGRMEVISRFPVHSLKELDDLWRKVQLGAVVRVFGDIEISEKKGKVSSTASSTTAPGNGSEECEISGQPQRVQWSALLHCLDFDVLEMWQGQDPFEPNPGAAEVGGHQDQGQRGTQKLDRKRKCDAMGSSDGPVSVAKAHQQQRGDASQPHCKFWLNSGKCNKEQCPFWHETDAIRLKAERRRWVEERVQAKRQISHHALDPHQKTTKNQHRERALYFAQWLISTFTREFLTAGAGVLDVAGGRGDLSWELQTRQGIRSTIIEPRAGKGMRKWQRKWLEKFKSSNSQPSGNQESDARDKVVVTDMMTESGKNDDAEDQEPDEGKDPAGLADFIPTSLIYPLQATEPDRIEAMMDDDFLQKYERLISEASILIGLHPDQATEPIVRAALKAGKPFAVIPCCVFSRDNLHRRLPKDPSLDATNIVSSVSQDDLLHADEEASLTRPVTSYDDFVTWLSTLHPGIETTWLNFEGMNRVLYWRGPTASTSI